jgi:hypothetical protein
VAVAFAIAVGKIEAHDVHPGLEQGADAFAGVCGRAEGADNLGFSAWFRVHGVIVAGSGGVKERSRGAEEQRRKGVRRMFRKGPRAAEVPFSTLLET